MSLLNSIRRFDSFWGLHKDFSRCSVKGQHVSFVIWKWGFDSSHRLHKNMKGNQLIIKTCLNCKIEFKADRNSRKFCSKSWSTSFNNKKIGARHGNPSKQICPECGSKKDFKAKLCHNCNREKIINESCKKPIDKFIINNRKQHPRFKHNRVRVWAKKLMEYWNIEKKCICGYDKHVECCHKKPISEFPLDTPMGIVNGKENPHADCSIFWPQYLCW